MKTLILAATAALLLSGCNNAVHTSSASTASPSQNETGIIQTDPQDSSSEDIINGNAYEPK